MVMFDSLNRRMLPPYGCDWVKAPNFKRLAERTVTFDNAYVGSMPCMPARRELHTGRYNFLHRAWGPLEPFDDSMPGILKNNNVYTHLVSDHGHYWEDGGCTYHTRYSSWEINRGQEGDPWKGEVKKPEFPKTLNLKDTKLHIHDRINRKYMQKEEELPLAKNFANGMDFIRTNYIEDRWFLQLETFDPHEPFCSPQKYKDLYPHDYSGPEFDWPEYKVVSETPEQVEHCRFENAALISMCDEYLGKVLDLMDELDMWKDTMLIVNTDHGFLLGEHDWWGKMAMPYYNEIANMPLFIWDPRCSRKGERCDCLVQTIDLAPTLLEFFGVNIPLDMQGKPLKDTIAFNKPLREAALYGMHGGQVNCTDGKYTYMRAPINPDNQPLYNYTIMPTHMRGVFSIEELKSAEFVTPFSFTKGCKVMRTLSKTRANSHEFSTLLFDIEKDPKQENPIQNPKIEKLMLEKMIILMKENDTPLEQFERLGIEI